MNHRYLFTLEVAPVETGKTYAELPLHLTLMSRFFSDLSPEDLATAVRPMLAQTKPIELVFGKTTELGPKKLIVHMVEHSDQLKQLHNELHTQLDSIHADYEYPQFIGEGYKPHITRRDGEQLNTGDRKIAETACLIEIVDGKRVVRSSFVLTGDQQ
jgi:2'-5' RNA ligase